MGTPTTTPAGLPPGATVDATPVQQATTVSVAAPQSSAPSSVQGLPPGATVDSTPLSQATTINIPSTQAQPSTADDASIAESGMSPEGQLAVGALKGVGTTVNGLGQIINKVTGSHIPDASQYLTANGAPQDIGKGIESVLEFMGGDEALKGMSIADSLGKMTNIAKLLTEHPGLAKVAAAGVAALRGGTVGAVQGAAKTGGTLSGAESGGIVGATGGTLSEGAPELADAASNVAGKIGKVVGNATDRIGNVVNSGAIQDTLQGTVRNTLNDVAREAGVPESNAASVHNVAKDVSDALLKKAGTQYDALDTATGGRFQRFSDAIKNVQQKLREVAGIDPEAESSLIEKLNTAQDAHDVAMQEAEAAGLPKDAIAKANASFRQGKAMLDLSKKIRASGEGLPEDMSGAVKRPIPYKLNPTKLSPKLQAMIDNGDYKTGGRLGDAVGPERATALRAASNTAQADTKTSGVIGDLLKKYSIPVAGTLAGGDLLKYLLGH